MKNQTKWIALSALTVFIMLAMIGSAWHYFFRNPSPSKELQKQALTKILDNNPDVIFIYDPILSYRLKPSFRGSRHDEPDHEHVTNSLGLLGKKEPDPNRKQWLFLGDSVLYGEHVEAKEIFAAQLQTIREETIQILNAGCPGWSTRQELIFFNEYLHPLINPEKVFVFFCLNDLLRFEWVWRDGKSFQMSEEVGNLGGLLATHCRSLELLVLRDRFKKNPGLAPLANLNNTCLPAWLKSSWKRYEQDLKKLLSDPSTKSKICFIALPARAQLEALNQKGKTDTVLFPQKQLKNIAQRMGFEFIDALGAFQVKNRFDTNLFLSGERGELHLSPNGHRALAIFLDRALPESKSP